MAIKPGAQNWTIKEQIIVDDVSGLTLQFVRSSAEDAPMRLIVRGALPYGSREFLFTPDGEEAGAGVSLRDSSKANWLKPVK